MAKPYLTIPALSVLCATSVAQLRTAESNLFVTNAQANIGQTPYTWDAADTDADDGETVIKPNDIGGGSPGRWKAGVGGWTRKAGVLFPTTITDSVAIGANTTLLGEKLRIEVPDVQTGINLAIAITNSTPATALIPDQRSPSVFIAGTAWDGAAPQTTGWGLQTRADQSSPPGNHLDLIAAGGALSPANPLVASFIYFQGAAQGIIWGEHAPLRWQQDTRTSAGAAFDMVFEGQNPLDGNGAGIQFLATDPAGTGTTGGSFAFTVGGVSGLNTLGQFSVASSAGTVLLAEGNTKSVFAPTGRLYAGIDSTLVNYVGSTTEGDGSVVAITTESAADVRGLVCYSYSNANNSARLQQIRYRGTRGAPLAVQVGDGIAAGRFWGHDGTALQEAAAYLVVVDDVVASGIVPGRFVITTTNASGVIATRTFWKANGRQVHDTDLFSADGNAHTSVAWRSGGNPSAMLAGIGAGSHGLYLGSETVLTDAAFREGNSGLFVVGTNGQNGITIWSHGGGAANVVALGFSSTAGTRSAPTQSGNTDLLGLIDARGYSSAGGMISGVTITFEVDGAVTASAVPGKMLVATRASTGGALTTRWTLSNDGSQTWVADTGASMTWTIGSNPASLYLSGGGVLYCGTSTTAAEDAGSIVSVSSGSDDARGFVAYRQFGDANPSLFVARKSRGTRASPTTVANGDTVGRLGFEAYIGATGTWQRRASIRAVVDNVPADGSPGTLPTALKLATGTTVETDRLTIGSDGSQIFACDTSGTFQWLVNTNVDMYLATTGALYVGASTTTNGEGAGSVVSVADGVTSTLRGLISYQHNTGINGASINALKSRGTRSVPTITVNGDVALSLTGYLYDGAAYQNAARIRFLSDNTISAGNVPCSIELATATATTLTIRMTIASGGSQTHNTDAAGTYTWKINSSTTPMFYSGDALYVGTTTTNSEAAGTIMSVCTSTASRRGLILSQHNDGVQTAQIGSFKSRGSFGIPTAVANADGVVAWTANAHDGTGYINTGRLRFSIDAAVSTNVVPMQFTIETGAAASLVLRSTWASTGSQTHNTDASGTYTWKINSSATPMFYSGDVLYIGTTTTASEVAGALVSVSTAASGRRGLLLWQHSDNAASTRTTAFKSRGTRSAPTEVLNGDNLLEFDGFGYLGGGVAGYVNRGLMFFTVDSAPNNATSSLPTAWILQTGSTAPVTRITVASTGSQTHDTDASQTYRWRINTAAGALLSGSALYVGTETTTSEDAGSIVSACTTSGFRGLNLFQHSADTVPAFARIAKSRGTRSAPAAVAASDQIGLINFYGYAGATGGYSLRAEILAFVDAAVVDGSPATVPIGLYFYTGTTAATQRVVIASTGSQTHNTDASGSYIWKVNSTSILQVDSTQVFIFSTIPLIIYNTEANTNPSKTVWRKDRAAGAAANGDSIASLEFQGHDGTAVRLRGQIKALIDGAVSNGTLPTTVQILAGASSASVIASFTSDKNLALFNDGTANAQSMVGGIFFADKTTAPTGNPTAGHYYWSDGGVPAFRTANGDVLIVNATSATTANTGANGAPPAQVAEYMVITFKGNTRKVPLYVN